MAKPKKPNLKLPAKSIKVSNLDKARLRFITEGTSLIELAEEFKIPIDELRKLKNTECWSVQRDIYRSELTEATCDLFTNNILSCSEEIVSIIQDPMSRPSDKIQAYKLMVDVLGLSKKKIEVSGGLNNTHEMIQVVINREPVKPKEIIIDV